MIKFLEKKMKRPLNDEEVCDLEAQGMPDGPNLISGELRYQKEQEKLWDKLHHMNMNELRARQEEKDLRRALGHAEKEKKRAEAIAQAALDLSAPYTTVEALAKLYPIVDSEVDEPMSPPKRSQPQAADETVTENEDENMLVENDDDEEPVQRLNTRVVRRGGQSRQVAE